MADEIKSLDDLKDAVSGDAAETEVEAVVDTATPREPVRDEYGRAYATGKRKDAVARVWIKPGSGKVVVNGKEMAVYFARPVQQLILRQPFQIAGVEDQFDVMATVKGGGLSGQLVVSVVQLADDVQSVGTTGHAVPAGRARIGFHVELGIAAAGLVPVVVQEPVAVPVPLLQLAQCLSLQGRHVEAEAAARRALELAERIGADRLSSQIRARLEASQTP